MRQKWPQKMGNISFFLGGRAAEEDPKGWQPDWTAIKAAIRFAAATGRLAATEQQPLAVGAAGTAARTATGSGERLE
jgi:hypothetical protein